MWEVGERGGSTRGGRREEEGGREQGEWREEYGESRVG
jgi:hypothetical protein